MAEYLLGIVGILVSVLLFLIGFRQTIGAKRERVATANAQLERTLIRRVVLEKHTPSQVDLSRLIEGKARDYRVRSVELLSENQLLNTIYTRITESDLIPPEQRDEILQRLSPSLIAYETAPLHEEIIEEAAVSKRIRLRGDVAVALLGMVVSVIGGLVTVLPNLKVFNRFGLRMADVFPTILGTAIASLLVIAVGYVLFRVRASQVDSPR